jgi:hypothetical protein
MSVTLATLILQGMIGGSMRRLVHAFAAVATSSALSQAAQAAPCPPVDPGLAGYYVLSGQMEVGSELALQPDGQFEFMLAYGANDQYGSGCWSVQDSTLALHVKGRKIPNQASPEDRKFRGMYLVIEPDGRLGWPLPGFRGKYERQ